VLVFNVGACLASEPGDQGAERSAVIVVVGAAGSDEYRAQFVKWAQLWEQACSKGGAKFASIGLSEVKNPDDRTALQQTLATESQQSDAALWLVLIGHGTFDGRTAKFNPPKSGRGSSSSPRLRNLTLAAKPYASASLPIPDSRHRLISRKSACRLWSKSSREGSTFGLRAPTIHATGRIPATARPLLDCNKARRLRQV